MESLKTIQDNIELYNAGLPHFPRNFTRDSIISAILMKDPIALRNQLLFASIKQGTKKDSYTGEEPGKIFHEFPGVDIGGHSTLFNACDTTALFIIGHFYYDMLTQDAAFKESQREKLLKAVEYIKSHLKGAVFYEDPKLSDSDKFALKVTYWKDSELLKRVDGIPVGPVAYFLAQAINLAGIRCASTLLGSQELADLGVKMQEELHSFFDSNKRTFYIAIDSLGPIDGSNSDLVHALLYLQPGDLSDEEITLAKEVAMELETPLGYLTLSPKLVGEVKDSYHATTIWPFEQAIINMGARKFKLARIEDISRRIVKFLDTDPEILIISGDQVLKRGCDPQLWTIAAKKYFASLPADSFIKPEGVVDDKVIE